MKKLFTLIALMLCVAGASFAQCALRELSLNERFQHSSLIVEAKILHTESFLNDKGGNIFTACRLEVFKIFRGTLTDSEILLITEGGTVGNRKEILSPSLIPSEGESGIFFLYENNLNDLHPAQSGAMYRPYGDLQGVIRYDLVEGTAHDPFKTYRMGNDLYELLQGYAGHVQTEIQPFSTAPVHSAIPSPEMVPSITSFSPTTISAGTNSTLTINGSGFGATQGVSTVRFKNGDDGGASYISLSTASTYSWSDTQIKVRVTAESNVSPATGTIQVVNGTSVTSSSPLTVSYSEMNVLSGGNIYQTDFVNLNTTGGYTWTKNATFNGNAGAVASFGRAFENWKCSTGVNWVIGSSTTTVNTDVLDGTNVICFDAASPLPGGVLGRCRSYYTSCATGVWYVNELDIKFSEPSTTTWNFSTNNPAATENDFESVALHELGHGHQLNHVISNTDVMHYALTQGTTRRVLNTNNITAGNDIMTRSHVANSCGPSQMTTVQAIVPNAGSNVTICGGGSVTLGSSAVAGHTYSWSPTSGLSSATVANPVASPSNTQTYTLTESNTALACSGTATVKVTLNGVAANFFATPLSGVAPLQVAFHDSSTLATSWAWDVDNSGSTDYTTQNPNHTYSAPGTYTVVLKINSDCSTKTKTAYIVVGTLGTGDLSGSGLSAGVFPNPAHEHTWLKVNSTGTGSDFLFTIYDLAGRKVLEHLYPASDAVNGISIKCNELAGALYFYEIRQEGQQIAKGKLLIQ